MSRPTLSPATLPIDAALDRNEALSGLMHRLHESNARHAAIRHLLPAALAQLVRPGPLDDSGWALLVPSGAAAAKLRQCLPALDKALRSSGWPEVSIRIKVVAADAANRR